MRLEWTPPLDDGGAVVSSYQIFVDNNYKGSPTNAMITVDIIISGEHVVEVRAVNCAGYSTNVSSIFLAATDLPTSMIIMIIITEGLYIAVTDLGFRYGGAWLLNTDHAHRGKTVPFKYQP